MQQKLIITLWKAQFRQVNREESLYCRLTYNGQQRNSKASNMANNFAWKETFILNLSSQQIPLRLDFIPLSSQQQIHFAKDHVAQSLTVAYSTLLIERSNTQSGTIPCKMDVWDVKGERVVGKVFIEYEAMKTEVAYTVEKQLDYYYMLKLSNFKVSFVRLLKKTPRFYLRLVIEGKQMRQDLPFEEEQKGLFVYSYPIKLYLKKEVEMQLQLFVKNQDQSIDIPNEYNTETSFSLTERKTSKSSVGKKEKMLLDIGKQKIWAEMDLNFKRDVKVEKKLPLSTFVKTQKRDIGMIEFLAETSFRTKEELQALQVQKRGVAGEREPRSPQRKRGAVRPSNGVIVINSMMVRLELFNEAVIQGKDMSMEVSLGKQIQESTTLEQPGKELIIIDTFVFKRTWQETIKIAVKVHERDEKLPLYFTDINLRQLFEIGKYTSKKVKLRDENKNYTGELIVDMYYKQQQIDRSLSMSVATLSQIPEENSQQLKVEAKRQQIEERMRRREEQKRRSRELASMSTLAVLQDNQILLPPLKSAVRKATLSPNNTSKNRLQLLNNNHAIKFAKSPRFPTPRYEGYDPYTYSRESDFDTLKNKKRGTSLGYGNKHDFVKPLLPNPGVGRYEIPSVWNKYK